MSPSSTLSGGALAELWDRVRRIEHPSATRHGVLPFGVAEIDRALPGSGLALGAVHEILGQGGDEEDGAAPAGFAASILARLDGPILWCLRRSDLHGLGLAAHGLDPARLVIVRAARDDDILWAVEEGLRSSGLAAVVGEVGRLPMVASRRLQLAAERSGVTALILRRWRNAATATTERERPSATVTRWRVAALSSADISGEPGIGQPRWQLELLRCRGGIPAAWNVETADATDFVCLSAGLADRPAAPPKQTPAETIGERRAEPVAARLVG